MFELSTAAKEARNLLSWINEIGFDNYPDRQVLEEVVRAIYKSFCAGVTSCRIHRIFGSQFDNEHLDEHFFDLLFVPFFYPAATQSSMGDNIEQLKEELDKTEKERYLSNFARLLIWIPKTFEAYRKQQTLRNLEIHVRDYISVSFFVEYFAAYGLSEQEIVNLIPE